MSNFGGKRYYDIPRRILSWVGLWPEGNIKNRKARRIFSFGILVFGSFTMPSLIIIYGTDIKQVLSLVSVSFATFAFAFKYGTFIISSPKIIKLMNFIKDDWATLMNEKELRILENYMNARMIMIKCIAVFIGQCSICFIFFSLLPCIFMLINPSSTPRRQKIPVVSLWLEGNYYNIAAIYLSLIALIGGSTLIGIEGLIVMYVQHACGMFSIACYRVKLALDGEDVSRLEVTSIVYDKLINVITLHQRAIEFAHLLALLCLPDYTILLVLGVCSLSVNLFRLSQQLLLNEEWGDLIFSIVFVFCHFVYMFCTTYITQCLINESLNMFVKIYDTKWYRTSLPIRKLLLIIMQRSMKSSTIPLGGLFVPSLDGFNKLMSLSFSYFMFMYKMR